MSTGSTTLPGRSQDSCAPPGIVRRSPVGSLSDVVERAELALSRLPEVSFRMADLAHATGVSVRTLYRAFARHHGIPPITSLRRSRLGDVRRRLEAGGDAVTVTSVAYDCGFYHLGRLAGVYRRQFGELPSDTLRRARGR